MHNKPWEAIFKEYRINEHNFDESPFNISAEEIKEVSRHFGTTGDREVRVLCKQDTREDRPDVFKEKELFILPIKNKFYTIIKGEGYVDIPQVTETPITYKSKLDFKLDTSKIGDSEMQHIDFAYASSLIRNFMDDESLVLTIRGRKYTPEFSFFVDKHKITAKSVQTEVDAGYEGKEQVILIEAKRPGVSNTIIRQLYYPYRQWQEHTSKKVIPVFFEKDENEYFIWEFEFKNIENYNSISLVRSAKFVIS
ncbi:hypothetical protein DRQ36_01525 [bacterium]|nr:MAG: hypothetical protein DRQ36_01525 [bacterium]